jgi:23S rRNA (cytosine1962-C5)-methyltransferase
LTTPTPPAIAALSPLHWQDYELIDSGGFEKLERYGDWILARPEPQAVWDKSLSEKDWEKLAHAAFKREADKDRYAERGRWVAGPHIPERWYVGYQFGQLQLRFKVALSSFKHVGVFPEQAANWDYLYQKTQALPVAKPKILNLFAYTGLASLAAKAAGADVAHVDSVRQVVGWARDNMEASQLDNIRWVVEDALTFVEREVRRGNVYHGIILDPPAYGRGPNGEKWVLEDHINALIKGCAQLLHPEHHYFVINLYSMGFSPLIVENLVKMAFPKATNPELGELFLADRAQKKLPLGIFYRFASV